MLGAVALAVARPCVGRAHGGRSDAGFRFAGGNAVAGALARGLPRSGRVRPGRAARPVEGQREGPGQLPRALHDDARHFVVAVTRAWAPLGADRFYNLVEKGFFDGARFFRVVPRFVVQFGLNGDPRANAAWEAARIADDPVKQTNARGRITFATAGPGTRTTQLFINLADNARLDQMGFAPFGEVAGEGMAVVESIYAGYGETPDQGRITMEGNTYLEARFPRLDYVKKAEVVR